MMYITKNFLKEIILDQQQNITFPDDYCPNYCPNYCPGSIEPFWKILNTIIILSGIRRYGKSALLHNIRKQSQKKDFFSILKTIHKWLLYDEL